ncbi:MFS transporter [Amycolatopsis suaedae]|uniref:MFS transporter n=1 Tax=Amycolatopsis suaedae TaxID=2510978 RepID=A0A4Q7JD15_9PSEU|nr:MFS transporter [Amycolatopsis suaedae]RZQ64234.1 MFS transporter [Amycolatopsis suaedae]
MYLTSRSTPDTGGGTAERGTLPSTVFALGTVSLLTDISAEMITAFLPVYLLYTLQLGYVQFGLLDGLYNGATALLRLVGGYVADRLRRPKLVALAGYGASALAKLAFPVVGASGAGIGGVLAFDRAGKGLRTGPRDALISLATPPGRLGRAFGVHRAMDTIGALLGPLVTFWILAELGSDSTPVFVLSFGFALVGVIVLAAFVRDRPAPVGPVGVWTDEPKGRSAADGEEGRRRLRGPDRARTKRGQFNTDCVRLLRDAGLRRVTVAAGLLGLATISDAFVFVVLQKSTGIPVDLLPLLPLGTALVFLSAAVPLGRAADRFGRWPVFFAGHVLLLAVYLTLLVPGGGYPLAAVALVLHGLFYAATDGVLMAYAGALVPEHLRASGLAVVQTGQAVARLVSSLLFGVLLTVLAMPVAVLVAACAFLVTLTAAAALVGRSR